MRELSAALVLGGSGFLGRWVVSHLAEEGIAATVVDPSGGDAPAGCARLVRVGLHEVDVAALVRESGCQAVFHLAGSANVQASVEDPAGDVERNVGPTVSLLSALRELDAPPVVVFASSAAVYGEAEQVPMSEEHPLLPLSPYGTAKLACEEYLRLFARSFGVPGVSARMFSVYGPGQRKLAVYEIAERLLGGEDPLTVYGPPDATRDFVFAGDTARALVALARRGPGRGEAYNIASGCSTSVSRLVSLLCDLTGRRPAVAYSGTARVGDPVRWDVDTRRAEALGVRCETPLEEGLRRTLEWLRE
jgi:nucleoside-diphosphate-sugar epimerase